MPILRLNIYQPQAHYRIPFTYQRRHTYPIPPYSTVIGFLCNACGVDDQNNDLYKNVISKLKIAIAGKFKVKNTEMIWYRNLSKKAHEGSYGSIIVREKNGNICHIGGQAPMSIDVLEDVELNIYIYHDKEEQLKKLKNKLEDPVDRLQVLHLGRAEDWIVFQNEPKILLDEELICQRRDADYKLFFWIPNNIYKLNNAPDINFNDLEGNLYRLTTFSNIENYENHYNHTARRIYKTINAKLNDGKIFGYNLLIDKELNIPIFLGEFEESKES
ncbi:MAG: type I-B CRISPR-associated protein Cas5 [Spirochaetales bacterium]|jgi:CRISPR-associated protein Cas5t|nr:type I-B CRISPR-associated protein Cas5b [Exilispira sp.]NMC66997.1 type I-B CRISPR-associated protein Cas5 [Spirochaetales bacterium]